MSQLKKYPFAYLASFSAILALGFFFLPNLYATTMEGTRIYFRGAMLAFGGEVITEVGGSVYSFSFSINIFALILLMCLFLSGVAALLSKESFINRIAASLLALAAVVLAFMLPNQVGQTGLSLAYGSLLCIGFAFLSIAFNVLAFLIRPKKS